MEYIITYQAIRFTRITEWQVNAFAGALLMLGGVLKVEIRYFPMANKPLFYSSKTSDLLHHLHF